MFEDDSTKIVWAMSYMKSGRANRWPGATRKFEQEAKAGRLRFLDWDDFEDEFRKDFMPLDAEAAAINVLETTTYFQGKQCRRSFVFETNYYLGFTGDRL